MRCFIKNVSENMVGEKVCLKGSIWSKRELGSISFVSLRDLSGFIQIVVEDKSLIELIQNLQLGSCLEVVGRVKEQDGTYEVLAVEIKVLSSVTKPAKFQYYINEQTESLDFELDNRAVALRSKKNQFIFRIQAAVVQYYRKFMLERDFTEFFPPAMLASASEGGSEIFELPYFDGQATLAQSSQLYKQILVGSYERVFGLGKWFRAENSHTRRHLTEGHQLEFEMGFIEGKEEVMKKLEEFILNLVEFLEKNYKKELELLGYQKLKTSMSIPVLKFEEACKILEKEFGLDTSEWVDLSTEGERNLVEYSREKLGSDFLFVINIKKGPFYCLKSKAGEFENFDLLCREAEISSGGQRVHIYEDLINRLKAEGLKSESFQEYLSTFQAGMPPHGGFGLGLERLTMLLIGLENIREACLFPSDPKRVASQKVT